MCYDDNARPPVPAGDVRVTVAEDVVLTSADGTEFAAYMARPEGGEHARVVIFPDVRGLHQFYKELAVRFAEQGVQAIAIDYFGRTAGLGPRDDSFEYAPHVQQFGFEPFQEDVVAAVKYLDESGSVTQPTFTVGFCMGGALSLLTATRPVLLAGAVALYAALGRAFGGAGTVLEGVSEIKYPVLGLFGGADQVIPVSQVEELDQALDETGVEHEIVVYPGAPHSFFDRRASDFAEESTDAWTKILSFIAGHKMGV